MTPNPTPADRLEAAITHVDKIEREIRAGKAGKSYTMRIPPDEENDSDFQFVRVLDAARAHLADLRRENTRTASASMEAKPQAGSRPLIRHYVDEHGNEMVALAKWFYDEMVSCMPDGPPTALEGEE